MSNNIQKIIEYAKDPSCVMCVTPSFGGAWHSSIRTGEGPRPVLPPVAGDSIAQRLGLLTKYNCDTSNLDFRLASTAQNNWYVKTGLNFAGWSRPLTIIGRMYIASDSGGSDPYAYDTNVYHPLLAQGYPASGSPDQVVLTIAYSNYNNVNCYEIKLSFGNGTLLMIPATSAYNIHGEKVTIGVSIAITGEYRVYENGVLIKSAINSNLIGFVLRTDTSHINNDQQAYLHQQKLTWQNRNDRVDWCMVFDRVLNDAEIKYLSYDRDDWVDLSLPVEAGTINIITESIPELEWTLPDGTKSTATTLNQTIGGGILRMKCYKYGKSFQILSGSTATANTPISAKDLPRVTNYLYLYNLPSLTGTASDLPRVTNYLYLYNLPSLTGSTADLPRVAINLSLSTLSSLTGTTADLPRVANNLSLYSLSGLTGTTADLPRVANYLYLYSLSGLTGTAADLPSNTGPTRQIIYLAGITGALPVVSTNTNIYYYGNAQVTPAEYDQTIQNIVDAGGVNGTLRISNTRTSASDANIATLQSRGWTVTEH